MTPNEKTIEVDLDIYRRALAVRMDALETKLDENTETTARVENSTRELVSILNSWKGAMSVFEFVGKIAKPAAAIIAFCGAIYAWWQHK